MPRRCGADRKVIRSACEQATVQFDFHCEVLQVSITGSKRQPSKLLFSVDIKPTSVREINKQTNICFTLAPTCL